MERNPVIPAISSRIGAVMLRITTHANRPESVVVFRRGQEGVAVLWVVIGVAAIIAAFLIVTLQKSQTPAPVTSKVYDGSVTAPRPFPTKLDNNIRVTYKVTTKEVTVPYGAEPGSPPTSQTNPVPVENAVVVFKLAKGDATFSDNSTSKSVATGSNGEASVTIKPAQDGGDTLTFEINVTTATSMFTKKTHTIPDTDSFQFEVDAP